MTNLISILAMGAILGGQVYVVRHWSPLLRAFFVLQAVYWALSYILRPIYVLVARPDGRNPITDPRLLFTNFADISSILGIAIVGQTTFLIALVIADRRMPTLRIAHQGELPLHQPGMRTRVFILLIALGWIGRVASITGIPALDTALGPLVSPALGLLVVYGRFIQFGDRLGLTLLCLGEGVWAVVDGSKTPILTVIVAIALRWAYNRKPRVFSVRLPALLILAAIAFLAIQPLKGIDTASQSSSYSTTSYPELTGAVTAVVQRFDLFASLTDAYYYPRRPWLSTEQYLTRAFLNAVPKGPLLRLEDSVGQKWAAEVKAATFPNQFTEVSLATSFSSEGYVQAGLIGSAVAGILAAAVSLGSAVGLTSPNILVKLSAATYIFGSVLFEEGLLGQTATVPKVIEVVALTAAITWLLAEKNSQSA